ncbi:PilN domain-containing protein [Legionella sp. D16C41]|uniref:PilN domain-containing protein n=1 Tax=Legionella sp. D16C41 TaxID=3402688 RepID=UPI003AF79941
MTNINLLPWRELRREQEKRQFTTLLIGSLLIGIGIVILINYYVQDLVTEQMARNQRLQDEINTFNRQIAAIKRLKEVKAGLISRMKTIQGLQEGRTLTVHLFDELIKVVPDGIYLTQVKRVGDTVTLHGYAESNTNVSILMRNIEQSPWIQTPALTEIKKSKEAASEINNEFVLSFVIKAKNPI